MILRNVFAIAIVALLLPSLGCQKKNEFGKYLSVAVSPKKATLIDASVPSCTDYLNAAKDPSEPLSFSINKARVFFASFRLEWKNPNAILIISEIRITMKHPNIKGGEFKITLSLAEVEALVGQTLANLPAAPSDTSFTSTDSNNTNHSLTVNGTQYFFRCGLTFGGISFENLKVGFSTRATIEVRGFSYNATTFDQETVRQSTTVDVEYLP